MPAVRTAAAENDLRGIAYQIGIESGRPILADKIVDEIVDVFDQLAASSHIAQIGTSAPEIGHGIRLLSSKRWVILFRYVEDGVIVLRIADGSQDYLTWKL